MRFARRPERLYTGLRVAPGCPTPQKKLLGLLGALWLAVGALSACTPALSPSLGAVEDGWLVTLAPTQNVYSVTLHVLDSATDDERCIDLDGDVACVLGDIPAGEHAQVLVAGLATACSAFGYTSPVLTLNTYRPFPCNRAEGGELGGR